MNDYKMRPLQLGDSPTHKCRVSLNHAIAAVVLYDGIRPVQAAISIRHETGGKRRVRDRKPMPTVEIIRWLRKKGYEPVEV